MRSLKFILLIAALFFAADIAIAQESRPASPRGKAATQFGGQYEGRSYTGGTWIEIDYGRPILRGRTGIFGSGEEYGQAVNGGAPVWRLGANQSTQLTTEADLVIGGTTVPAGTYTLFVDLKAYNWTLIVSKHKAKSNYRSEEEGLWGAYDYTDDKDVVRVPMTVEMIPMSLDQLTIGFYNMTSTGGTLAIWWDDTQATVNFSLAN